MIQNSTQEPVFHKYTPVAIAVKESVYEEPKSFLEDAYRQNWSEIDGIYEACATSVVSMASGINQSVQCVEPYQHLVDSSIITELNILVSGFKNDIETFTRKLLAIKSMHEGKSGLVNDGADLMLCLGVFEQYVAFDTEFKAITFPTMLSITERIGSVLGELNKLQAKETNLEPAPQAAE